MQPITRQDVEDLLSGNERVALIEALPEESFRKFHLPGAINIPADADDFDERVAEAVPEKSTPVIVYCLDSECQASPKAARKLDALGYDEVYDYEAGKRDWRSAGKPIES